MQFKEKPVGGISALLAPEASSLILSLSFMYAYVGADSRAQGLLEIIRKDRPVAG
jgi:hypothetical protein